MSHTSAFIVLIERLRLRAALAWMLATATLLAALLGLPSAHAQTASSKIATDW
jgi:hypothetical protein